MQTKNTRRIIVTAVIALAVVFIMPMSSVFAESNENVTSNEMLLADGIPNADYVSVYLNGKILFEKSKFLLNNTTYVPIRAFCEALDNCDITWSDGTATVNTTDLTIKAKQNYEVIEANGRSIYNSSKTKNVDGRIYVPIRSIAKAYCLEVEWDSTTRSVNLTGNPTSIEEAESFYNSDDLYWLARIINSESGGEILLGKIAVGNVVINRTRKSEYPDTIYGVIFDKKYGVQFSPVAYGTIYKTPNEESVIAAEICLEGYSLSDEIIFFINPKIATNFWITQNRIYILSVGNHDFYK